MEDGTQISEIITKDSLELEIDSGEVQLLAIISNEEYICYAINIQGNNYLMFNDNKITDNLIYLNKNIIVVEDNKQKEIKLIYKNGGFLQKRMDNITITLVKYSGNLNQKNIIKYDENYYKSISNNYYLKNYKRHLKALEKDIENENLFQKKTRNTIRQSDNTNPQAIKCLSFCISAIILIILIILCIIFPKFGEFLEALGQIFGGA